MSTSADSGRAGFEAFATSNEFGTFCIQRRGEGYWSSHTHIMWMSWKQAIKTGKQNDPPHHG